MISRLVQLRSSLLQCKSISKRWRCTVPDSTVHDSVLVVAGDGGDTNYIMDKKGTISSHNPPWITQEEYRYITLELSNSCNGMILIPIEESFFLFNPLTKYYTKVLELDLYFDECEYTRRLGLCYDERIDDYKALVLVRHHSTPKDSRFVAYASLKEKKWTKVKFPFSLQYVEQGPFFNGRLHWISYKNIMGNREQNIACFDPVMNTFETLPPPLPLRYWIEKDVKGLPPYKRGIEGLVTGLGVIEGCLWMTRRIKGVDGFEVLEMKEYGVAESWTSMFVLPVHESNPIGCKLSIVPLRKTENGRVLFYKPWLDGKCGGEVFEYNPETNLCTSRFKTSGWTNQAISFVNNSSDSPVDYFWDPIQHRQLGRFSNVS